MELSETQTNLLQMLAEDGGRHFKHSGSGAIVLEASSRCIRRLDKRLGFRSSTSLDSQLLRDLRELEEKGLIRIPILDQQCTILRVTESGFRLVDRRRQESAKDIHWWGSLADAISLPIAALALVITIVSLIGVTVSLRRCKLHLGDRNSVCTPTAALTPTPRETPQALGDTEPSMPESHYLYRVEAVWTD